MMAQTIVENFDVFEDIKPGLDPGLIVAMKDQFGFEGPEKTFDGRVIITITFAAHTTDYLGFGQ